MFFTFSAIIRSEAFASQPSLEKIDLRFNRISSIEGGAFGGLTSPKEIFLAGNRLILLNSDVFEVNFWRKIFHFSSKTFEFVMPCWNFDWSMTIFIGCDYIGKTWFEREFHFGIPVDCFARSGQFETVEFVIEYDSKIGIITFGKLKRFTNLGSQ